MTEITRLIEELRAAPRSLASATETMGQAADMIDRMLTAIANAQSALTYDGLPPEDRLHTALAALSFANP